nr:hypothetical protein [Tanacetum cinerariifolium]
MIVTTDEQGFISAIYEEKTRVDLYTCLFACFFSQKEPKMITNALKDPTWVEAMQEELLQFHLQKCKKQTVVATSTTEAEYVAASSCCVQFWRTASVRTLNNEEIELNATVDGHDKTITEASVMRH